MTAKESSKEVKLLEAEQDTSFRWSVLDWNAYASYLQERGREVPASQIALVVPRETVLDDGLESWREQARLYFDVDACDCVFAMQFWPYGPWRDIYLREIPAYAIPVETELCIDGQAVARVVEQLGGGVHRYVWEVLDSRSGRVSAAPKEEPFSLSVDLLGDISLEPQPDKSYWPTVRTELHRILAAQSARRGM